MEANRHRLTGRYANYFEIGHNPDEVVFDFGHGDGPDTEPFLHTRVVMTPTASRALMQTLSECLGRARRGDPGGES